LVKKKIRQGVDIGEDSIKKKDDLCTKIVPDIIGPLSCQNT